jgi:UDP:flavonoid glycosyltransferase YjiC (YdhE family)
MFPSLPLMKGLVESGHEVHWLGSKVFQRKIENTGSTFHPLPESHDFPYAGKTLYEYLPAIANKKGLEQVKAYVKWFFDEVEALRLPFQELAEQVDPDVLIGDPATYSPLFWGEQRGKPTLRLEVLPPSLTSVDTAPFGSGLMPGRSPMMRLRNRILNFTVDGLLFRDVTAHANSVRKKLDLPPYGRAFRDFLKHVDKVLITSVPGFDYERSDMMGNHQFIGPYVPRPDPTWEEPEWWGDLERAHRVVLVNQGTIANDVHDLIVPTLLALKDEPDTVVVAVPVKEAIPNLPANARVAPFIPFGNLMPHVDVVVTNGGYGGANIALGHGKPIIIGGATEDKMEVAQRVTVSGTGINMKTMKPTPVQLKAAVHEVTANPKYKQNALRLKAEIESYDSVSLFNQAIQQLVTQHEAKRSVLRDQRG